MKIIVDNREKQLHKVLIALQKGYTEQPIPIDVQVLPLGDVILCDDDGSELIIYERKSLTDLAASISDGRYKEQSFRLHHVPTHNHNIVYLIEGVMDHYIPRNKRMSHRTLFSAMCSIHYYKGFSVFRSFDMMETAEYILQSAHKLLKGKGTKGFYNGGPTQPSDVQYSSVVKRVKKNNLTPENIGEVILSQIPGISTANSLAIMKAFGSLYQLMCCLNEDPNCLQDITYTTKNGQQRRVSQTCINSIVTYLLYQKESIIKINTNT